MYGELIWCPLISNPDQTVQLLQSRGRGRIEHVTSFVEPSDFNSNVVNKGTQCGSSIPRSRLKFSLNPVIPTVYSGQSRSRSYNFVLVHFLNLREPFRWVMIFSTSIDSLKSMVTVRRKFISFH